MNQSRATIESITMEVAMRVIVSDACPDSERRRPDADTQLLAISRWLCEADASLVENRSGVTDK